jgi:hypothetical protein
MTNVPVGSPSEIAIGNNIAMVAMDPRPGNKPISVPNNTPVKHHSRYFQVNIISNPVKRLFRVSILLL